MHMSVFSKKSIKCIISIIALLNIAVMMLFSYGLPSLVAAAEENNQTEQVAEGDSDLGIIEEVAQENAEKEQEAAETALAKGEAQPESEEELDEEAEEEERDPDAPILELTDDHIYLNVGDRFNYMSYIKTMKDVDGSDLSHYIYLNKDVDTSVPGDTELTYRITSTITGKTDSKVLLITVQ